MTTSPEELPPPYPPRIRGFWQSFTHAWNGLVHTVVHQPNMRTHVTSGLLVALVGSGIPLGLAEKVTLLFCVMLVFFAEILNSALESLVDLATRHFDEEARITKDAAAAGVLVLSIGTVVIFAALLVHNWDTVVAHLGDVQRQAALGVPLVGCAIFLMRAHHPALWMDLVAFGAALGIWGLLALRSTSYVFSAMTLGLLVLTLAAALNKRHL